MEALTGVLLVAIIATVLFLLFIRYKVNKIKKKEEEFNKNMDIFTHIPTGHKSITVFKKRSTDKLNPRHSINYGYIAGTDPAYESSDDYKDNSGTEMHTFDGFGDGGSFGGGGASGSWGDNSSSSSSSSDSSSSDYSSDDSGGSYGE